jgi:hypothetical protein
LLATLKPALKAACRHVRAITLHDGQRYLPASFYDGWTAEQTLVIVDGYEQLGRCEPWRLARRCRIAKVGLLVTAHKPVHVPTLIRLEPDRDLILRLVAELCAEVSTRVTKEDVTASHDCHGSNVREIFFDLYDRHERGRRQCVEV